MPEYLAPGVYIEEVSFRAKSIEGVSTTTTGFIGPARYGPTDLEPDVITSLGEFELIYGDRNQLRFGATTLHNYLWHAVRAFFEEGGKRLYITRVYRPNGSDDGRARGRLPATGLAADALSIAARFPGAAGNLRVRIAPQVGQNILGGSADSPTLGAILPGDVVWISDTASPIDSPPGAGALYLARFDEGSQDWEFSAIGSPAAVLRRVDLDPLGDLVRVVTVAVTVLASDGSSQVWSGLALDPAHARDGVPDSLTARFAEQPSNLAQARTLPLVIEHGDNLDDGLSIARALFGEAFLSTGNPDDEQGSELLLDGGDDGLRPGADEYEGRADADSTVKTGLRQFEDIEDISIVAAPGSTFGFENGYRSEASTIVSLLVSHAQRMRYRIAVLDSGDGQSISQVRAMRARLDSTYGALYYPWVRVLDPVTRREIYLPPSGFVAGIYARNDVTRAVYKAPANEVVNLALGFEIMLNKAQQDVLNPEGINCFRFFEGRGFRLWGARTISSDPEWKYVNLRRYFAYLERSIDRGTQWAVFEPNGELLWANVRRTIEDFLLNEWQSGALLGDKPEKAYFVRCDRSTMTQNDLDNGRLVCLIGVAALRPAEFVIFRIGQWTSDRRG
ncbi:MAG: phage tail sheath family protein [Chloroflexales bacterium]|nr:phage tail sheath family protein [Chloroflexales bacterium]